MQEPSKIAICPDDNWGMLVDKEKHTAAVGARLIDHRSGDFEFVPGRMTAVGEEKIANALHRFVFSKKMLRTIKKETHYPRGGDESRWRRSELLRKDVAVSIDVVRRGEYCYIAAYADRATQE